MLRRRIHICDRPDHLFQDEIVWYVEGVASWMQKHDCNVRIHDLFLFHEQILRVKSTDICLKILPGKIGICDLNEEIWCVWWDEDSSQKPFYKFHICNFVDEQLECVFSGQNLWHKIRDNTDKCVSCLSNEQLLPKIENKRVYHYYIIENGNINKIKVNKQKSKWKSYMIPKTIF